MELENNDLIKAVTAETPLKEMIVTYIGERLAPESGDITVAMAVEVFAAEFPEFLLAVAEENFVRGYHQGISDAAEAWRESATTDAGEVPSEE